MVRKTSVKNLILAAVLIGLAVVGSSPTLAQPADALNNVRAIQEARLLTAAQDEAGTVWAVWEVDTGNDVDLHFSVWTGGAWSDQQPVHLRPGAWDRAPSLAVAADGTPWLAWSAAERSAPERNDLFVSRWAGDGWIEPERVPVGDVPQATEPALAAAPDGSLWLAWVGFDGTDDEIYASHWQEGVWSAPRQISDDDDPALWDRQPQLAVGQDGRPWLVWTGHQEGVDDEIMASRWMGSSWTPEQMVSQDDDALDVSPSLALDAQGTPWVAWKARVGDEQSSRRRILVSNWDPGRGDWTAEAVASSPLSAELDEGFAALAVDSQGQMNLAWLADGALTSALAHTRWAGGEQTGPQAVRSGVHTYDVHLFAGQDSAPRVLWLDPEPGSALPLHWAVVEDAAVPLEEWTAEQTREAESVESLPFPNKYMAFGDSITWGLYPAEDPEHPPHYPYPSTLQDMMRLQVSTDIVVVNAGEPGEGTPGGKDRIKEEVSDQRPKYVMIMEGTNDVSRELPTSEAYENFIWMIDEARKAAGVEDVVVMLSSIVPRLDDKNDETLEYINEAIIPAQQIKKHVRWCDPWQAFYDYGPSWPDLYCWWDGYCDEKHPNQAGLDLLADTFYECILFGFSILEETTPPTTWMELPADGSQSECGAVSVEWTGTDNMSWVVDYDVQRQINGATWTDWLMATQDTTANFVSDNFGDVIGFRVRGRDLVGNQNDYSDAVYTTISDSDPPYETHIDPLEPILLPPFVVSWGGQDACADVVAYRPQYRAGLWGTWQDMLPYPHTTSSTSAIFSPAAPQYGEIHYFRVSAQDEAGNWSPWPTVPQAETLLAQYSVRGNVFTVRHQPVAAPQLAFVPAALHVEKPAGGEFLAYMASGGDYDITASRNDRFGPLPTMQDKPVNGHLSGLEFILPPQDDAVTNGGFEAGGLTGWQVGGSLPPAQPAEAHTGLDAVKMGSVGYNAQLSQVISPAVALIDPTLSFMVRLEMAGPVGTLEIELANSGPLSPPVTYTLDVATEDWAHAWYDLGGLVSEPLTLTFTVSGSAALLIDEVSLGSALRGAYQIYLPLIARQW